MQDVRHFLSLINAGAILALAAFFFPFASFSAEAASPEIRFDVQGFQVEGNTLLPQEAIDALLAPHRGRDRTVGDLRRAAGALEAAYREQGFGLVRVVLPEQELRDGRVQLRVLETRLGKVRIEGNKVFDNATIRRSLPALREGAPPDLGRLSSNIRQANDNPSRKTSVRLQGGERAGEVDALVSVADSRPWRIGASIDNSGIGNPGKQHIGVSFLHAGIGGRDHVLAVQYITALEHPGEVNVIGAAYRIPLYALGDSIDLFGIHSDIDAGTVSTGPVSLQVSGNGEIYGARYNLSLARSAGHEASVVFGADYKAYHNDVKLSGVQLGNDVTVHPVGIGYAASWTLARTDLRVSTMVWHNIPGGSHGSAADIRSVRASASPHYTLLRYGASATHAFARDWQVHAAINGLYTEDSLIAREQFGAGGADTVRGFNERDLADDTGYAGRLELYTPNLCAGLVRGAAQCRALVFHDRAHVARNHVLPGERSSETIASAGLGLRLGLGQMMALQLDVGRVTNAGGPQEKGEHRMHFLLNVAY